MDAVIFLVIAVVFAILAVRIGIILAPLVGRLSSDEDDEETRD